MAYGPLRRRWFQLFAKAHGAVLLRTDGRPRRLGRHQYAFVLVTTGRRSGVQRAVPLLYMPDDATDDEPAGYVLIASNYGQERPPAWYLNLTADPHAEVRTGGTRIAVMCRELEGDERAAMLVRCASYNKQWRDYQGSVHRTLPVLRLTPA